LKGKRCEGKEGSVWGWRWICERDNHENLELDLKTVWVGGMFCFYRESVTEAKQIDRNRHLRGTEKVELFEWCVIVTEPEVEKS
jgi:hypothetical protein